MFFVHDYKKLYKAWYLPVNAQQYAASNDVKTVHSCTEYTSRIYHHLPLSRLCNFGASQKLPVGSVSPPPDTARSTTPAQGTPCQMGRCSKQPNKVRMQ
eukprot:1142352-Pelagomonas_calceolata.AAC.6